MDHSHPARPHKYRTARMRPRRLPVMQRRTATHCSAPLLPHKCLHFCSLLCGRQNRFFVATATIIASTDRGAALQIRTRHTRPPQRGSHHCPRCASGLRCSRTAPVSPSESACPRPRSDWSSWPPRTRRTGRRGFGMGHTHLASQCQCTVRTRTPEVRCVSGPEGTRSV